ncbi:MAG: hypothetical protein J6S72_00225 [Lachnospiraceae bacterium]|nr:hypothetical protein [Lachnospiraceae bacterium]
MRKNSIKTLALLILAAAFFLITPAARASAAEFNNETHYLKISVDDDVLIMTQDTAQYDEIWQKAGIADPSATLKSFKDMGVVASFYEPSSKLTVNLITNRTSSTADVFSFAGMSDSDILDYMNNAMSSASSQSTALPPEFSVSRDLNGLPFVRIFIDARSTENPCSEVIYGTIINGEMLQFDTFTEGKADGDESFLRKIVSGVSFSKILTPEEYEELVRVARLKLIVIIIVFVVLIALVIFLFVFLGKRRDKKAKQVSDAMTAFRERMAAGEVDMSAPPTYTITTSYDEALFERLGMFRAWICPEPTFVILVGILAVVTISKLLQAQLLHVIVLGIFIVVLLYMHYSAADKAKDALKKRYDVKSGPKPTFRFYDEFFKVTGLPSASEYIYGQVTAVRTWSDTLYIFLGDSQIMPIRLSDLTDCTAADLKNLIRSRK